jgi:hypothetical protein
MEKGKSGVKRSDFVCAKAELRFAKQVLGFGFVDKQQQPDLPVA